jgi:hypothetical protein
LKTLTLISCLTIAASFTAHAITNGSFENPAIADGTLQAIAPNDWIGGRWIFNPNASGGITGEPNAWPSAQDGAQYENLGNSATTPLLQAFEINTASLFECIWYDSTAIGYDSTWTSPYTVTIRDSLNQTVFTQTYDAYNGGSAPWIRNSFSQVLAPDSYSLTFSSLSDSSSLDALIDNVSALTSIVPEPSSALLVLSAATFCLGRRTRRA